MTTNVNLVQAFHAECTKAKKSKSYFVSLVENIPFYGGPEEGGWWGSDQIVKAYEEFPSLKSAKRAVARIKILAAQLDAESRREFGDQCLREMDWCDSRNVDYDYLPEVDGETTYSVLLTRRIPENRYGTRGYA